MSGLSGKIPIGNIGGGSSPPFAISDITNLQAILDRVPIIKYKTADQTITSDNTLNDDADLIYTGARTGKKYVILLVIFLRSHAAPDFQHALAVPAGTTGWRTASSWNSATPQAANQTLTTGISGSTNDTTQAIQCLYSTDALVNDGSFIFRWAQVVSDVNNTTVYKGSVMMIWEY